LLLVPAAILAAVLLAHDDEPPADPVRTQAWVTTVEPRLETADRADAAVVERRIALINSFFEQRKRRAKDFAESVLSTEGKLRLVWSKLPGTDEKGFAEFVRDEFARIVFRSDELKAVLRAAISGYQAESDAIENRVLVELRADLADGDLFRSKAVPALSEDEAFRREYQRLLNNILPGLERDLAVEVGHQAITWIGMDLVMETALAQAVSATIAKLGVSSGLLGAGAASTIASLGVGLVACWVIDELVNWILKDAFHYDPVRDIQNRVADSLEEIRKSLIDGDPKAVAVYTKLRELERDDPFHAVRDECRMAADRIGGTGNLGLKLTMTYFHELRCRARKQALHGLVVESSPANRLP
jgi:hypothetical protein